MSSTITVDPGTDPIWNTLVSDRDSDVFQSPPWLRAVAQTYRLEARGSVLMAGSQPAAGLAYARVDGLSGPRLASFPFSDYCDPIVSSTSQWQAVLTGLPGDSLPLTIRCLHSRVPLSDERVAVTGRARWHGIDLLADDPWARLDPSARRAVRRSRRDRVEVAEAESSGELRAFYELHLRIRKHKYRLLAQPYRFFENLWREFIAPGRGALLLARIDDKIAAGVLFLEWKDTLYYKFNASDARFSGSRPNDALMWAGIEHARRRGARLLDLGLTDQDQDGLIRYKRKYASEEKPIVFLSRTPDTPPAPSPPGRLAELMPALTRLLTDERIPDTITERAGAALYRYFA